MSLKFLTIVIVFGLMTLPQAWAQGSDKNVKDIKIPYTIADRDMIRETIILMRQGFEDARKDRQAMKVALETQIKANREALEAQIKANREALEAQIKTNKIQIGGLEKRLEFLQNLMIALLSLTVSQTAYLVWRDNKIDKKAALKVQPESQAVISPTELQNILERLEKLEQNKENILNT